MTEVANIQETILKIIRDLLRNMQYRIGFV